MKKLVLTILAVVFMMSATIVASAAPTVKVTPSKTSVTKGEQITVQLVTSGFTEIGDIAISTTATDFTYVSATQDVLEPVGWSTGLPAANSVLTSASQITIAAGTYPSVVPANKTIVTLTLKAPTVAGTYPITIKGDVGDMNGASFADLVLENASITVVEPVTGVTVSPTSATVAKGANTTLTATVAPTTATKKNVTWKSSNTSIATVSPTGVVTGVKAGSVTITVTTVDGDKTATASISVIDKITAITGAALTITGGGTVVGVGSEAATTLTVAPTGAGITAPVVYVSSDNSVATVSAAGVIKGVSAGTAIISATVTGYATDDDATSGGKQVMTSLNITVQVIDVTGVTLPASTSVYKGKTVTLTPAIAPTNASNKGVTYISSDESIATVSTTGVVTGVALGTADITVTTDDGAFTATTKVTVSNAPVSAPATSNEEYALPQAQGVSVSKDVIIGGVTKNIGISVSAVKVSVLKAAQAQAKARFGDFAVVNKMVEVSVPAGTTFPIQVKFLIDGYVPGSLDILHEKSPGVWEALKADKVENGAIYVTFNSLSPVAFVFYDVPATAGTAVSPKTGQATSTAVILSIVFGAAVLAFAGVVGLKRKKA